MHSITLEQMNACQKIYQELDDSIKILNQLLETAHQAGLFLLVNKEERHDNRISFSIQKASYTVTFNKDDTTDHQRFGSAGMGSIHLQTHPI